MFPLWVYFVVAAIIAGLAFAIAQLGHGLGVAFLALASTLWVAVAVNGQRKLRGNCGN